MLRHQTWMDNHNQYLGERNLKTKFSVKGIPDNPNQL